MSLFSDTGCNESLWALFFCDRQAMLVLMDDLISLCFVLGRRVEGMSCSFICELLCPDVRTG